MLSRALLKIEGPILALTQIGPSIFEDRNRKSIESDQRIWGPRVGKIHYFYSLSPKYTYNALSLHESRPKIQFYAQFTG